MDILKNAEKRAILPVENNYVFNSIYFSGEGLTSTSANHVSAMANVMAQDIKERLKGLRLYRKFIRVIGEEECCVEERNNTLPEISEGVEKISKCNALIAWLREAIKERERCMDNINATDLATYCKLAEIDLGEEPTKPTMPRVNMEDPQTILAAGLTIKEYNRYLELKSTLAVYGELVHENGLLTEQKMTLQRIAKNPIEVKESGRDTIITRYESDTMDEVENLYTTLQAKYRQLQAEKNGIEAKWSNLAADYQVELKNEYDHKLAEYREQREQFAVKVDEAMSKLQSWKKNECDKVAALKIVIPNDLAEIYKELRSKYL